MPQTECISCGTPYESQPNLSVEAMRKRIWRSRLTALIAIICSWVGLLIAYLIYPPAPKPLPYEVTGPGTVRYYDVSKRMILHENHLGFMKMLEPTCSQELPVWNHMQANILFKWKAGTLWSGGAGPSGGYQCYEIISVQRTGPDAQ